MLFNTGKTNDFITEMKIETVLLAQMFQPTVTALSLFTSFIHWNMGPCHSKTV